MVLVEESVLSLQRIVTSVTQVLASALCSIKSKPNQLTILFYYSSVTPGPDSEKGKCLHLDPTCHRN